MFKAKADAVTGAADIDFASLLSVEVEQRLAGQQRGIQGEGAPQAAESTACTI